MNIVNRLREPIHYSMCWSCGLSHHKQTLICSGCAELLPYLKRRCRLCGLPQSQKQGLCVQCQLHPAIWREMVAPLSYQAPINYLIQQFKYNKDLSVVKALVELVLPTFVDVELKPQLLVPVPLHKNRFLQRGFNQSLELTALLSKGLNIPFNHQLATRVKDTSRQSGLKLKLRQSNIKNAFVIDPQLKHYEHIAIVDDVITSGSTVTEMVKSCLKVGVKTVDVWAIARTLKQPL